MEFEEFDIEDLLATQPFAIRSERKVMRKHGTLMGRNAVSKNVLPNHPPKNAPVYKQVDEKFYLDLNKLRRKNHSNPVLQEWRSLRRGEATTGFKGNLPSWFWEKARPRSQVKDMLRCLRKTATRYQGRSIGRSQVNDKMKLFV